jgi:hypothetical protein
MSKLWLVPVKHSFEYGMFRNILGDIRKAMGVSKPFQELDKIANGITLTNDFNRPLKYIINKSGSNILPKHSMEDVANVIELTIPMALSTNEAGR